MKNSIKVKNIEGEDLEIEFLLTFKIEKIGKEYIVYSINDDGVSPTVNIFISEIKYENSIPKLIPIKEDEKEMVLLFYENIRSSN